MLIILVVLVLISVHITKLIHTIHDLRICISLCMCIYIYTSLFIHSFICLFVYLCVFQKNVLEASPLSLSFTTTILTLQSANISIPSLILQGLVRGHLGRLGWVCLRITRYAPVWCDHFLDEENDEKNICTICIGRVGNIRWITIGELLLKDLGNADFI